jgi:hypothetical protein
MNMRNLKYFSFGIISLIFASCIEEKNLSTQNEEDLENAELGLSTDFSLKTERSISITATDSRRKTCMVEHNDRSIFGIRRFLPLWR